MYAEERHSEILKYVKEHKRATITQLAELLNTSNETIRRDVKELDQRGLLKKTHGGAILVEQSPVWYDVPLSLRESRFVAEKKAICACAAQFVQESDSIFLDNSSTVLNLVPFLPKQLHITLITNSIKLLLEIAQIPSHNWTVLCVGGAFKKTTLATNSFLAMNNLKMFRPTKAFLSCHGINTDLEMTDNFLDDVEIKEYILRVSKELFLLADSSKFGLGGVISVAEVTRFHHLITDKNADPTFVKKLLEREVNLQIALDP